jgi:hypothetical protein
MTFRSSVIAASVLAVLVLAPTAHAALTTIIRDDADAWTDDAKNDLRFEAGEQQDLQWHLSAELFPLVEKATEESPAEQQREQRMAGYVSADIGGRIVAFRDVPEYVWFAPYVRSALDAGIVSGYKNPDGTPQGLYGPANGVTIEELAKIAVNLSGGISSSCPASPKNVAALQSWSSRFISCAENAGWAVYSDGSAELSLQATRAQVVVTMLQAFGVTWEDMSGGVFTDVTDGTQFGSAIEKAKADGLVNGYADANGVPTGLFGPSDPVTRAEIAKIAMNARQLYGN